MNTLTKIKLYFEVLGMALSGKLHKEFTDLLQDVTNLTYENADLKTLVRDLNKVKKTVKKSLPKGK